MFEAACFFMKRLAVVVFYIFGPALRGFFIGSAIYADPGACLGVIFGVMIEVNRILTPLRSQYEGNAHNSI
jgi:hypothetical protein